jgi:hypothetical protein
MLCEEFNLLVEVPAANRSKVNVVRILRKFYDYAWFMNQTASWNSRYVSRFTEMPTRRGFGSTFNMLATADLFTNE